MWSEGAVRVPESSGNYSICHYCVKHFDEGSAFGIDEGRISKLSIEIGGVVICRYDRGWDIEPESETAWAVFSMLMAKYN